MLTKKIFTSLLECHTEEDIFNLLKDEKFPYSDRSKFSDNTLRFMTSAKQYTNIHSQLTGLPNLAFKTLLLLKLHGHLGSIPKNSGTHAYASDLIRIIRTLCTNIQERMDEITPDRYHEFIKKRSEEVRPKLVKNEFIRIQDWIAFANPLLPYILRLDERLVIENSLTLKIRKKASLEHHEYINGVGGIQSKLFPLADTKKIMQNALKYVENYADEILLCTPIYLYRKGSINDYQERKYIAEYFKKIDYTFREPILKKLQEDSIKGSAHKVARPAMRLRCAIRRLEGACVFIALSLTGYRAHEFIKLSRFPEFRQEEHEFLTRLVTKTSIDEEGEEIEMPIPIAAKNAIEIISKLTALRDKKQTGKLLMSSWENKKVTNVAFASQRLSLAIKFFCKEDNLPIPTPHMTRHTMAFVIAYLSEGDSLELARLFLGHKSITMTLRYLGHFNRIYQDAMREFEEREAEHHAKQIANEIRYGKKLYGKNGEKIIKAQFMGVCVEEFANLLETGLIEMVKLSQYIILNTPYCYCIHDKLTTENMPCQHGLNKYIEKAAKFLPLTGRCKPGTCNNAVFTEKSISRIQAYQLSDSIPEEFKKRISENIYFIDDCGLEELDTPLHKIIQQYNQDQKIQGKA